MKYWILDKKLGYSINKNDDIIIIKNALIERVINTKNGTLGFYNLTNGANLISEASVDFKIKVDEITYDLYKDFVFKDYVFLDCISDINYKPKKYNILNNPYPPKGKAVKLIYENKLFKVEIIYEIFEGIPTICKRANFVNLTNKKVIINQYFLDNLELKEEFSDYIYAETNYNGGSMLNCGRILSVYESLNNLNVRFDDEIDIEVMPNQIFDGMKVYELIHTAKFYEQRLIEVKEMYRVITPWVNEAPLIFHILSDKNYKLKRAIDMIKEANFDMIIQSFGSGLNMENLNKGYINRHKKIYNYAHSKGIEMGGYTLAIVKNYRPIHSDECNVYADPKGRIFRCLATEWSEGYWNNIYKFCDLTGIDGIEIDGPYHFYKCLGGETHNHKGIKDSRYIQWKKSTVEMLQNLKQKNMYVNAPDWLFLNGSNKTGIGYEEIAFSESRESQLISSRIYNYKGTFNKLSSMSWSFLPINVYHGGGKKACFSPLEKNIKDFEWSVFQHFIAGVIPCFRGKKLFEGAKSKEVISKWTNFYKKHKNVINGITVHFLPPRLDKANPKRTLDIDAILNVVPYGEIRGVLAVFNQTDNEIEKSIKVPLFYTGLGEETLPLPHKNCSIADVKNPVFGEYPPPFPTYSDEDAIKGELVTGMGDSVIIKKEVIADVEHKKTQNKVTFYKEETEKIVLTLDSNSDCLLTVKLKPMSYTYFLIKAI